MAALVTRLRRLGKSDAAAGNVDVPMDVPPPEHHSRRALRGWRVVLDKVWVLLIFAEHQRLVEEWFPQSQPSRGSRLEPKEETLADVYAAMIASSKMLAPLKSKDGPRTSISSCIHPKEKLRGGGNASQSYIVCKDCHARWENSMTTAEIKKYMKQHKEETSERGLLSQNVVTQPMMDTSEWAETLPMTMPMQSNALETGQMEMQRQIVELQNALQQEQLRTREVERVMLEEFHHQLKNVPKATSQGAVPVAVLPIQAKAKALGVVSNRVAGALVENGSYDPTEPAASSQVILVEDDDGVL